MRIAFLSLPACLIALGGCEKPAIHALEDRLDKVEKSTPEADSDLEDRVEQLEGALATALDEIETLRAANETLETEVGTLEENQVTASDLDGYATEIWVGDQGYGSAENVTANTDSIAALDVRVSALEESSLTASSLDGYATESWVTDQGYATATAVAAIEADYLTSSDLAGYATESWVTDQGYASDADLVDAEGEIADLTTLVGSIDEDYATVADLGATRLDESTAWSIGPSESADYADLHEALAAANDLRIHPDAYLYLQLEPGLHTYTETVHVKHRDGANIYIEGDIDDPSAVELQFSEIGTGIQLDTGARLGVLRGLTLTGNGEETAYGLYVLRGSVAYVDALHVENWNTAGLHVAYGGVLYGGDNESVLDNNGHYGALAQYGSVLAFNAVTANNNGTTGITMLWNSTGAARGTFDNNGNSGASSQWGSAADYQLSEARDNETFGFHAQYGGLIHAQDSLSDNAVSGFFAGASSMVYASESVSTNNSNYGYRADWLSYIVALDSTASGDLGDYEGPDSVDLADGAIIVR